MDLHSFQIRLARVPHVSLLRRGFAKCLLLSITFTLAAQTPSPLQVQGFQSIPLSGTPQQRFQADLAELKKHYEGEDILFLRDDSPAAIRATYSLWRDVADFVIAQHDTNPNTLAHKLCLFLAQPATMSAAHQTPEQQCAPPEAYAGTIASIAPGLLLVAPQIDELGTVFLIGPAGGTRSVLWSIADTQPQLADPNDLLGAWKPDRAGRRCRKNKSSLQPGSCGPLYAGLLALPPDDAGHPRFVISAGYAQPMGATIAEQTSLWRWDGNRPYLLWDDLHPIMADQVPVHFDAKTNTLAVTSKGSFRTMADCGACADRPLEQDLRLTASGIDNLGVHSLAPELDRLDDLFDRIARHEPTGNLAAPQVAALLRKRLHPTAKDNFYLGMIMDSKVRQTHTGATVCLSTDTLELTRFTLRRQPTGDLITAANPLPAGKNCLAP